MVMNFLSLSEDNDSFDFDLIFRGNRLEVKSIGCKFEPPSHFEAAVNSHDLAGVHKQDADFYVFVRILNGYEKGWILGYLPCARFFELGRFVKKGEEVYKGQKFEKANATLLKISALQPARDLLKM